MQTLRREFLAISVKKILSTTEIRVDSRAKKAKQQQQFTTYNSQLTEEISLLVSEANDMEHIFDRFSRHLFWDVDREELSLEKHRKFIVQRVLGHGQIQDWHLLRQCYPLELIVATAQKLRALDPKSLSFIACMGGVSKETFRCYTSRQSSQTHWIS